MSLGYVNSRVMRPHCWFIATRRVAVWRICLRGHFTIGRIRRLILLCVYCANAGYYCSMRYYSRFVILRRCCYVCQEPATQLIIHALFSPINARYDIRCSIYLRYRQRHGRRFNIISQFDVTAICAVVTLCCNAYSTTRCHSLSPFLFGSSDRSR